jgi:hypothetical protein
VLVGLFSLITGKHTGGKPYGRQGEQDAVYIAFSRDGFHWWRPPASSEDPRTAFLPMSTVKGAWNFQNVQSSGGGFLTFEDDLRFFVGGRSGTCAGVQPPRSSCPFNGNGTTGVGIMRRDGFGSLLALGPAQSASTTMTTRPLTFDASRIGRGGKGAGGAGGEAISLFVNADVSVANGCLTVALLDATTREPLPAVNASAPLCALDSVRTRVDFPQSGDLSFLSGKAFRVRFTIAGKGSRLYAFWLGTKVCGESRGYVAAGSASFNRTTDAFGSCSA